jgi:hypothetical protein
MEPGEALGIAALIAVASAGFASVVVVFRPEAVHEWTGIDKLPLRLLLANSILPLGLSMLGLLLLTVEPMPRNLAMVQRYHINRYSVVRYGNDERYRRLHLRNVQSQRDTRFIFYVFGAFGSVQHCVTRRILAISRESYTNSSQRWPNSPG